MDWSWVSELCITFHKQRGVEMFQGFKRAKYISQNNFHHWNTQDGVRMHLLLQKSGWPANEFVDWFMRVYPKITENSQLSFKIFMTDQYDWFFDRSGDALINLLRSINTDDFQRHDKDNLIKWIEITTDGAEYK